MMTKFKKGDIVCFRWNPDFTYIVHYVQQYQTSCKEKILETMKYIIRPLYHTGMLVINDIDQTNILEKFVSKDMKPKTKSIKNFKFDSMDKCINILKLYKDKNIINFQIVPCSTGTFEEFDLIILVEEE
jgi:hypothetical protein